MLYSTNGKENVFSYKMKMCALYTLFQKNHIFLDNRFYSKIKKSALYSFCCPVYLFLWWKRKSQTKNLYEIYSVLATIHFCTRLERCGGEWLQSILILLHPYWCTAIRSKTRMCLERLSQNRMVFFFVCFCSFWKS